MAGSPTEFSSRTKIRSVSLPSNSNPINKRIEQELEKLRTREASSTSPAETISIGLSGLTDLYSFIHEVLSLPLTQQALSLRHNDSSVADLLKGCSDLYRICSTIRGIVLQLSKLASDTRSALEMHHQGSSYCQNVVARYISSRKEVIKSVKSLILSSKPLIDGDGFGPSRLFQKDDRLSTVIKALTCISIINLSVHESLLCFLSVPVSNLKSGSLVSKLIHKVSGSKTTHLPKTGNDLKDVDVALHSLCSGGDTEKVRIAQKKLEELMDLMEDFGNSLDSACIQLTEIKVCLMNIVAL